MQEENEKSNPPSQSAQEEQPTPYTLAEQQDSFQFHITNYFHSNDDDSIYFSVKTKKLLQERLRSYVSHDGQELFSCVILGSFLYFSGYALKTPNQRPIPYQVMEDGSYAINLSHNEENQASTVPSWQVAVLCILLCPMVQLATSAFFGKKKRRTQHALCVLVGSAHYGTNDMAFKDLCGILEAKFL